MPMLLVIVPNKGFTLMKFSKNIFLIISVCFFTISSLQASPCDTNQEITLGTTASNAELGNQRVNNATGALYYKIEIKDAGRLSIWTMRDSVEPDNRVNTKGYLLDSSCNDMGFTENIKNTSPRYFDFYEVLNLGTYYLKVENSSSLDDENTNFRNGLFEIRNYFIKTKDTPSIVLDKYTDSSVRSGEDFRYKLSLYNDSSFVNTDIVITDTLDSRLVLQTDWNKTPGDWDCTNVGNDITCKYKHDLQANNYASRLEIGVIAPTVTSVIMIDNKAEVTAKSGTTDIGDDDSFSVDIDPVVISKSDISLNILSGYDEVEVLGTYYYNIVINKTGDENITGTTLEINTTSEADYVYIDHTYSYDWVCSKNAKRLSCQLTHAFGQGGLQEEIKIRVQAPGNPSEVKIIARVYSDYLDDLNLTNNSASKTTTIKETDMSAHNPREFTKVPFADDVVDMNIFGDILTIGNQSICEKDNKGDCQEPSASVNDKIYQKYANLDTSGLSAIYSTSTSATLDISLTDEIMWAGLYWMGRVDKGKESWKDLQDKASTVYIRHDSNKTAYHKLDALRSTPSYDNSGTKIMVDKYNFINTTSYFNYQGVADVTKYVKDNRGGRYWVADVTSSEGYNISAGWSLVVVVRDTKSAPTRELKNITLYDGYEGVWKTPNNTTSAIYKSSIEQNVVGFLTPSTGAITSKLTFFAFEGDLSLPDFIEVDGNRLKNSLNNEKDVVNGTISQDGKFVNTRLPNLKNTSGIDIDEFNLGTTDGGPGIIKHSQKEAKIKIGSLGLASNNGGGDQYYLGMFSFSTNLNDPVCYMQNFKNSSYTSDLSDSGSYIDDVIGIEVEIRNKETQTLFDVHSYIEIDKMFEEVNGTFELKNVGDVGFSEYSNLFEYSKVQRVDVNLSEVKTSIGSSASSSKGGDLKYKENIFIRFNAKIKGQNDDNTTRNRFSVSYVPTPDKKIEISRCDGEDQKIHILKNKPNGFEVTHRGGLQDGVTDGMSNGAKSNENHLFTQVVNQGFYIDIVALQDGVGKENLVRDASEKYRGLVQLQAVDVNASGTCESFVGVGPISYIPFDDKIRVETNSSVFSVDKNASFRVKYLVDRYRNHVEWDNIGDDLDSLQKMVEKANVDSVCKEICENTTDAKTCRECVFEDVSKGGFSQSSCSSDTFAIKPEKIELSLNVATKPIGGARYNLTLDSLSAGYDQNFSTSSINRVKGEITLASENSECGEDDGFYSGDIAYLSGVANVSNFSYNNVGRVIVTYSDKSWTDYEQNASSKTLSDCVVGSSDNSFNADNKVGCEVSGGRTFDFTPAGFTNTLVLENGIGNFNYMANDSEDISARLRLNIQASLAGGLGVATNYSGECFANDVNVAYTYNGIRTGTRYIQAGETNIENDFDFDRASDSFANGVSNVNVSVNFGRDSQVPQEPYTIFRDDFNVTVADKVDASVTGSMVADADHGVSFYYGRLNVPDIETSLQNIYVNFQYEVFCQGCDRADFPFANGPESADSVFWYVNNTNHNNFVQGTFTNENSQNGMQFANESFRGMNVLLGAGNRVPHSDRITYNPSPWLVFDEFRAGVVSDSFNIRMFSRGNWSGKGKIGTSVLGQDMSEETSKKMEW